MIKKIRKAVFPVAGLGTRFLPATKAMPKEMLPVVDKPLIQYAVEEAVAAGIEEIIFVTGRGKTALEDHFDRSLELETALNKKGQADKVENLTNILPETVRVSYTRQGEPLGLGHAIYCARSLIGAEPFAILLADDLFLSDSPCLKQMVSAYEMIGGNLVSAMKVEDADVSKYGIIDPCVVNAPLVKVKGLIEKPQKDHAPSNFAICGRYILQPEIFDFLESQTVTAGGEIQLTDSIEKLIDSQEVHAFLFSGERFDCGDKFGWLKANIKFGLQSKETSQALKGFLKQNFS